ncbi:hypothetical protein L13192_01168 [Pyrenophora tritici-repentis]|uniref:Uncharacterized protein n=2 Tax=Pyrenophora tritici-repentis TaxID=45151 RepID=A0A922NCQ7_9PLEO|nr:uncharacterized protein PTRG_01334 [Pyrenophora tritici-repentis Pt-1C-BFP]EDU40772.1 conserved hypothetical protein [Pyrenophora tritici-repentis Pt-1C-BFP]KAI1513455.1 hypothetical protein Ptr86124_007357 [Pyrenophora tritici-repentis]KAI1674421.1 hypothetical protein L13192_01168 [Pyrenophora tritici-repentis]KAI1688463.1 hypothetical protein KJE20_01640 [Pyrenophora tritici-repentis]
MSKPQTTLTPFQTHLLFFSTSAPRPRLTLTSALLASLNLGLNLPLAILLSLSLRILYAPYPFFWSRIYIDEIPPSLHRTQLSSAVLASGKTGWTCSELLGLLEQSGEEGGKGVGGAKGWINHKINQGHIIGFWTMAANSRTNVMRREDVERFQQGGWETAVAERRRGRGDVLPVWRGGPGWVGGHAWVVKRGFGVQVYECGRKVE